MKQKLILFDIDKTLINENPTTDGDTAYYITRYAFLRKNIGVKKAKGKVSDQFG